MTAAARMSILGLALFAVSCGSSGPTATVTGKVTLKGKGIYGGTIILVGPKDIPPAQGPIETDGNGTFSVIRVPTGVCKVGVTSYKPSSGPTMGRGGNTGASAGDPTKWFEIPVKYTDPNTSGKEITVKSGANTINIELD